MQSTRWITRTRSPWAWAGPDTLALDGEWKFQTDPQDVGEKEGWAAGGKIIQRTAKVPLPWELVAEDLRNYSGVAWYEREVMIPAAMEGKRINLGFHGVAHQAKVYVNGKLAGEHSGAQAPFLLDITALARPGVNNTITVRVFNPLSGVSFYLDSHSLLKVSGLWRSVWLEATGKTFISDLFMIPDIDKGSATARVTVCIPAAAEKESLPSQGDGDRPQGAAIQAIGRGERPAPKWTNLFHHRPNPQDPQADALGPGASEPLQSAGRVE